MFELYWVLVGMAIWQGISFFTMLLSNEKEDSLDDLILCLLTEENAKWNIEAFEGKLHIMREDYKLYLNQEKFNSMCEEGGYPYNNGGGYLS